MARWSTSALFKGGSREAGRAAEDRISVSRLLEPSLDARVSLSHPIPRVPPCIPSFPRRVPSGEWNMKRREGDREDGESDAEAFQLMFPLGNETRKGGNGTGKVGNGTGKTFRLTFPPGNASRRRGMELERRGMGHSPEGTARGEEGMTRFPLLRHRKDGERDPKSGERGLKCRSGAAVRGSEGV